MYFGITLEASPHDATIMEVVIMGFQRTFELCKTEASKITEKFVIISPKQPDELNISNLVQLGIEKEQVHEVLTRLKAECGEAVRSVARERLRELNKKEKE